MRDPTRGGRKVLLILDGYRSHMSLAALETLDFNNVIVYALPAHTSGKTQPLDVTIFSPFKSVLNEAINLAIAKDEQNTWDTFAFCSMLRYAYKKSFSNGNIISAFRRSGIWPLDAYQLLSIPRPQSHMHQVTMSVAELEQLLQVRRTEIRHSILGSDVKLTHSGFVDTTRGQMLTSYNAMNLAREKYRHDGRRKLMEAAKAAELSLRKARRTERAQVESVNFRNARWAKRAELAGMTIGVFIKRVRSLRERRAIARRTAIVKKQEMF